MSANNNPRPDALVGRKLPKNALWEQLQSRAQPLALEFCSLFFSNGLTYPQAKKWLADYGIKISTTALQGFYNSMDMRLRYASLQAEQSADTAASVLPKNIEEATRERVAQTMFEMSFMNLSENAKLQLIALQQQKDGMRGNFALKKEKLELERIKVQRLVIKHFLDWSEDKRAKEIASGMASNSEKIEKLGELMFGETWK